MEALIKATVAATLLGRPLSWVRWAAQHNVLPFYRVGRELRFLPSELSDYLARHRVAAADEQAEGATIDDRKAQSARRQGRSAR